jgi:ABC-type ATPase with predicted acetyltransferase domain
MDEDTLMRDPDVTIEARLKVDPDFATALYHEQRKRIAELEAQVPKSVRPITDSNFWECAECGQELMGDEKYCSLCGSKLNWEW